MTRIPGLSDIDITLRRSARTRRFSLRLSSVDGTVTLSMPARAPLAEAQAFARAHEDWLRKALARQPERQAVTHGSLLPVEGRLMQVAPGPRRGVIMQDDRLLVGGDAATLGPRLQAWLKAQARDRLARASDAYALRLSRKVSRITLRDTRSRWGSCTADGALMYSWRLILAPPAVLDYVAAHEVAHLVEMNHAPAFWAVVESLCPAWQVHRNWLRQSGGALHRWDFGGGTGEND
jgi:predicted metal-dependent hydrolase